MATPIETTKEQTQQQTAEAGAGPARTAPGPMWQSDETAQRIHNAFILGWSLVELRSRIQVAALDESKLPSEAKDGGPKQEGRWKEEERRTGVTITADPVELVTNKNDRLLRASRMRTAFNSIVSLQLARFPTSITIDTLYDPPGEDELPYLYHPAPPFDNIGMTPVSAEAAAGEPVVTPVSSHGKLRGPRYANIGIRPLQDKEGKEVWTDFRLFEVTRRAINCLTLLLVTPDESLVPPQVKVWQDELTDQILQAAEKDKQKAGAGTAGAYSLTSTAVQSCNVYQEKAGTDLPASDSTPKGSRLAPRTRQGQAIHTLSFLIVRLLQAWDGYLRERITAEGVDANNLVMLVAYEAGRNLATLSWNTSVNAVLVENQAAAKGADWGTLKGDMYQAWYKTFTDSNMVQVLHQITAMSTVLDDAYVRSTGKAPTPPSANAQDALLIRPDPARPSQVLQAVRESIEYWQRTVLWLGLPAEKDGQPVQIKGPDGRLVPAANKDLLAPEDWQNLRNALIEQSGIWFNLMTGQQDLRGFTIENITHQILDEALDQFRELAQKDLPAAAEQAIREVGEVLDSAKDSVVEIGRKATEAVTDGIKGVFKGVSPLLWGAVIISILIALGLVGYILVTGNTEAVMGLISSGATAVLSWLGIQRGNKAESQSAGAINQKIDEETQNQTTEIEQKTEAVQKKESGGSGLSGLAGGALGQAGDFLLSAYDKGLQRIQIELQALNYSVAVAHPLVEYFIRHKDIEVHEDFDFLTKVIWSSANREQQLKRVVTAAFGPISILLSPSSRRRSSGAPAAGNQARAGTAIPEEAPVPLTPQPVG